MTYEDAIAALEPQFRWRLDGDRLDTGWGGQNNHGSGATPTWVSSIIPADVSGEECGDFDGTVVEVPSHSDINSSGTSYCSMAVWFSADTIPDGGIIWEQGGTSRSRALYVHSGELHWYVHDGSSRREGVSVPISTGVTYFAVATMDLVAGELHLHVIPIGGTRTTASITSGLNLNTSMGGHSGGPGIGGSNGPAINVHDGTSNLPFDGRIADLCIWGESSGVILSEAQVDELFAVGSISPPVLLGSDDTNSAMSLTLTDINPSPGALLVIAGSSGCNTTSANNTHDVTTTIGDLGPLTEHVWRNNVANGTRTISFWTARVGSNPTSGSVTLDVDMPNSVPRVVLHVMEIYTVGEVVQAASGELENGFVDMQFATPPSGLVLTSVTTKAGDPAPVLEDSAEWTVVSSTLRGITGGSNSLRKVTAYRGDHDSAVVAWVGGGISDATAAAAASIEIREISGGSEDHSGGSTATQTHTTSGTGSTVRTGSSTQTVNHSTEGAGTARMVAYWSDPATINIGAAGGGNTATAAHTTEGVGFSGKSGQATAISIAVGSGTGAAVRFGSSTGSATHAIEGAGHTNRAGNSTTTSTCTLSGEGARSASGTSTAAVAHTLLGDGEKSSSSGSATTCAHDTTGAGQPGHVGGTTDTQEHITTGQGVVGHSGGSTTANTHTTNGTGQADRAGNSTTAVEHTTEGSGSSYRPGSNTVVVIALVTGTGFTEKPPADNRTGSSTVIATSNITGAWSTARNGASTTTATNNVTGAGYVGHYGYSTITTTHDITGHGDTTKFGGSTVAQTHTATGQGNATRSGAATASSTTTTTGQGSRSVVGESSTPVVHVLQAAGSKGHSGASSVAHTYTLGSEGTTNRFGGTYIEVDADCTGTGIVDRSGNAVVIVTHTTPYGWSAWRSDSSTTTSTHTIFGEGFNPSSIRKITFTVGQVGTGWSAGPVTVPERDVEAPTTRWKAGAPTT